MKIVSSEQIRTLDELTVQSGQGSTRELMLRAGEGFAREAMLFINTYHKAYFKRFVIVAGKGNNGGDAYVAANYLYEKFNCDVIIFAICSIDELSGDAKYYAQRINNKIKYELRDNIFSSDFKEGDVIIDGLLGTGFKGELKEPYKRWIKEINQANKVVIAIDVPSGLDASIGAGDMGIIADLTVTIALPKKGFFIRDGLKNTGKLSVVDIGIPKEFIDKTNSDLNFYNRELAAGFLHRIPPDIHKKSKGSVLVIGGSKYYGGAPLLSGLAALHAGAGFVTVAIPKSVNVNCICNSLIIRRIEDGNRGVFLESSAKEIAELIGQYDSIVIGPGMSMNAANLETLKIVLASDRRVIFDADALNLLAMNPALIKKSDNFVFTPHHGEAIRLAKAFGFGFNDDRFFFTEKLNSLMGGTLVYKGNRTITIFSRKIPFVNSSGSAALATAGSGDVLSGIIGAMSANRNNDIFESAAFAVYLHGLSGELAEIDYGIRGTTADNIISYIPKAMKSISPFA